MNKDTSAIERATLSVPEAAERIGISRNGAYAAAARGDLPVIRIGGRIFISRAGLERMLEGGHAPTEPAAEGRD